MCFLYMNFKCFCVGFIMWFDVIVFVFIFVCLRSFLIFFFIFFSCCFLCFVCCFCFYMFFCIVIFVVCYDFLCKKVVVNEWKCVVSCCKSWDDFYVFEWYLCGCMWMNEWNDDGWMMYLNFYLWLLCFVCVCCVNFWWCVCGVVLNDGGGVLFCVSFCFGLGGFGGLGFVVILLCCFWVFRVCFWILKIWVNYFLCILWFFVCSICDASVLSRRSRAYWVRRAVRWLFFFVF